MTPLPRLLAAGAVAASLAACGFGVESGVATGGETATEAADPAEGTADDTMDDDTDTADDTSMPADEDAEHDGSISTAEAEAVATAYLGLTEDEAVAQAEVDGREFRVGERDGEALMLTEDYVLGRVTATLTEGVVTAATVEASDGPVTVEE